MPAWNKFQDMETKEGSYVNLIVLGNLVDVRDLRVKHVQFVLVRYKAGDEE